MPKSGTTKNEAGASPPFILQIHFLCKKKLRKPFIIFKPKMVNLFQDKTQGCSQCAMLSLYFCSAKYCVKQEDVRKVDAMITQCKRNIKTMGQPYCCPELVNKEPQWGIAAGGSSSTGNSNTTSTSGTSSNNNSGTSGIILGNTGNDNSYNQTSSNTKTYG